MRKDFNEFQNNVQKEETFLLGYYGEGGIGSHPGILTPSELTKSGFSQGIPKFWIGNDLLGEKFWSHQEDHFRNFIVTDQVTSLPQTLVCFYSDDLQWIVKGISKSLGEEIMNKIGGDCVKSYQEEEMTKEIELMLGFSPTHSTLTIITIIPNPSPNTIYWSYEPEHYHSYWTPPYNSMSLTELASCGF